MSTPDLTSDVIAELERLWHTVECEFGQMENAATPYERGYYRGRTRTAFDKIKAALLSLAKRAGEMEWRTMDSAPKDGT